MAVQTKEYIFALLRDQQAQIRALGVNRLGLFGSFVHGQGGDESDVDVLVEFAPGRKTFDNFIQLAFFLEALFGRRVELVTRESLSPYLGPHILNEVEYVTFTLAFLQHILNETHYLMDRARELTKAEWITTSCGM